MDDRRSGAAYDDGELAFSDLAALVRGVAVNNVESWREAEPGGRIALRERAIHDGRRGIGHLRAGIAGFYDDVLRADDTDRIHNAVADRHGELALGLHTAVIGGEAVDNRDSFREAGARRRRAADQSTTDDDRRRIGHDRARLTSGDHDVLRATDRCGGFPLHDDVESADVLAASVGRDAGDEVCAGFEAVTGGGAAAFQGSVQYDRKREEHLGARVTGLDRDVVGAGDLHCELSLHAEREFASGGRASVRRGADDQIIPWLEAVRNRCAGGQRAARESSVNDCRIRQSDLRARIARDDLQVLWALNDRRFAHFFDNAHQELADGSRAALVRRSTNDHMISRREAVTDRRFAERQCSTGHGGEGILHWDTVRTARYDHREELTVGADDRWRRDRAKDHYELALHDAARVRSGAGNGYRTEGLQASRRRCANNGCVRRIHGRRGIVQDSLVIRVRTSGHDQFGRRALDRRRFAGLHSNCKRALCGVLATIEGAANDGSCAARKEVVRRPVAGGHHVSRVIGRGDRWLRDEGTTEARGIHATHYLDIWWAGDLGRGGVLNHGHEELERADHLVIADDAALNKGCTDRQRARQRGANHADGWGSWTLLDQRDGIGEVQRSTREDREFSGIGDIRAVDRDGRRRCGHRSLRRALQKGSEDQKSQPGPESSLMRELTGETKSGAQQGRHLRTWIGLCFHMVYVE